MDLSSLMGTLLSKETVEGVSQKTGASQKDVTSVLTSALPQLFSGANKQANDSNTAAGFASALTQHAGNDTSNIGSFLSKVDLLDGSKIVGHLLGSNGSSQVASQTGVNAAETSNIMSAAAPLLMSLLGKQSQKEEKQAASSGGIGGMLSGLFGGKTDVGGLVSGLFGGSKPAAKSTAAVSPIAAKNPAVKPSTANKTVSKTASSSAAKTATGNVKTSAKAGIKAANTGTATKKGTIEKKLK